MLRRTLQRLDPDIITPTDADVAVGMTWLVRNGVGVQVMETLTAGAMLTAFALELGASNFIIGVLAAVPHLAQLSQIPGVYLISRLRRRRLIYLIGGAVSRPMVLVIACAAFVAPSSWALWIVVAAFALRYGFGGLQAVTFNPWVRDLVPASGLGRFFGRRLTLMTLAGTGLGLGAAFFVDAWRILEWGPTRFAYVPLLVIAFLGGMYSLYAMAKVPEPQMPPETDKRPLVNRLAQPLRDPNFRRLLHFLTSWNFAINLAAPFFTVHMLTRLNLDLSIVLILTMISQLVNVLVVRQWGRIADTFTSKAVLRIAAPLFILSIFAWTFTTFPDAHFLTIPLLVAIHIVTGFATAGVTLASGSIAMKLAPAGDATAYLATNSLFNSVAAGSAGILGGLFADFFNNRELALAIQWRSPGAEVVFNTMDFQQ
ncbi:MAG: MFS transporter [Proteobacteria bacterium]|nr:MFS transporter [Pseudomonadota bacterium]